MHSPKISRHLLIGCGTSLLMGASTASGAVILGIDINTDGDTLEISGLGQITSSGADGRFILNTSTSAGLGLDGNVFLRATHTPGTVSRIGLHTGAILIEGLGSVVGTDNYAFVDLDANGVFEALVHYDFANPGSHSILGAAVDLEINESGGVIDFVAGVNTLNQANPSIPEPSSILSLGLLLAGGLTRRAR